MGKSYVLHDPAAICGPFVKIPFDTQQLSPVDVHLLDPNGLRLLWHAVHGPFLISWTCCCVSSMIRGRAGCHLVAAC